jgi:hypothetical protein
LAGVAWDFSALRQKISQFHWAKKKAIAGDHENLPVWGSSFLKIFGFSFPRSGLLALGFWFMPGPWERRA